MGPIQCLNTDSLAVNITASGRNVAGATYSLECTVYSTASNSFLNYDFTWLGPTNSTKSVPSEMVNTTGNMSTLTFDPLATSHAGNYTCVVTALALFMNEEVDLNVTVTSTLYVQISSKLLFTSSHGLKIYRILHINCV